MRASPEAFDTPGVERDDGSAPQPAADAALGRDRPPAALAWTPVQPGGANFRTHRLHVEGADRLALKASAAFVVFLGFMGTFGAAAVIGAVATPEVPWPAAVVGLFFLGVTAAIAGTSGRPTRFDRRLGLMWKGWRAPRHSGDTRGIPSALPLDRIIGLQLLTERVEGSEGDSYLSTELNLVLRDGERRGVVDHGGALRDDAAALAEFLGVPLWDRSHGA